MASEIRVDKINSLSGVGTVTLSPTGVDISGITTVQTLKVGTGVTASEDGDIFFTGVCTATTFAGSGANLTALPAANLSGTLPAISAANLTNVPAANITGTLPAISAANLTSIPAANVTGTLPALTAANLTNIPAANIVGVCTAGFERTGGFGGITDIDAWAISSGYSASSGANIMSTNWYQFSTASNTHFPKKGDSMSQSSGVWTFPKTGFWTVDFMLGGYNVDNNGGTYFGAQMFFSTDTGSSYDRIYTAYINMTSSSDHGELFIRAYIDVTNVSTNRLTFYTNLSASKTIFGDADEMRSGAIFTRIGDT